MISVITCTIRDHFIEEVFHNFGSQKIEEEKELIIILNKDDMDLAMWKERASNYHNVSVFQLPEETSPGLCQNFAVHKAKYNIIAKFDDDDFYSPYYLKEQLNAFHNTDADIVGKRDCFYYLEGENKLVETTFGQENQFVERVTDSSLMFRKEIFQTLQFPDLNKSYDNKFQQLCLKNGFKIYSTDKYNYTVVRRQDKETHTWGISDKTLKRIFSVVAKTRDYKSYVTKPID
ncbi:glycosyltransferase [Oceanobacillus piezotolerans]|uniref:Glycosyltransferase n=1 Tax=Oceanobacillus piezotolerans TaxID=2448030 RepID=A0A498DD76_9BACI|nr:glycosyltransferase [Oceanobacillus piezotolerans]RLL46917.1 glycosyltransferase [Oceanobacillus piezotolerans]